MSTNPSPGTLIEETDPVILKSLLAEKRRAFALRPTDYAEDPSLDDAANSAAKMLYDEETAKLTAEQIGLVMKIRGITTAPKKRAKAATNSRKKPTPNFDEFEADIMNMN